MIGRSGERGSGISVLAARHDEFSKCSPFDLYWSTDNFIEMPAFTHIMARDRFLRILSFFHLSDNLKAKLRNHPEHDKAHKIQSLFEKLCFFNVFFSMLKHACIA